MREIDEITHDARQLLSDNLRESERGLDGSVGFVQREPSPFADKNFGNSTLKLVIEMLRTIQDQRKSVEGLSKQLLQSQNRVVELQDSLIKEKQDTTQCLTAAVESAVSITVEKELKSYSSVVESSTFNLSSNGVGRVAKEEMEKVVRDALDEDDRSRNVMLFGLPEQKSEYLERTVEHVFEELGEKPVVVEACRIGRKSGTSRPVLVTVSSSTTANRLIGMGRRLRYSNYYYMVYLAPDRTLDQRIQRREYIEGKKQEHSLSDSSMKP